MREGGNDRKEEEEKEEGTDQEPREASEDLPGLRLLRCLSEHSCQLKLEAQLSHIFPSYTLGKYTQIYSTEIEAITRMETHMLH